MTLRVGFVREHFACPLLQFADEDKGQTFTLVEHPGGTGSLIAALQNNEVDLVIALTDALIAGIACGCGAYKLVGTYVSTPLNWAVITGKNTKYQAISDLKGTTIGISRPGSGSQTMAAVMAMKHQWFPLDKTAIAEKLKFKVNNNIHGLVDSVNDGSTSAFMWEWFTTKPWVDRGEAKFIGSIPTPWPSWLIAAHPDPMRVPHDALHIFLTSLSRYVQTFDSPEKRISQNIEYIKERFNYSEEDIKAWLQTVRYPPHCDTISIEVIKDTLSVLEKAGVVHKPDVDFEMEKFINFKVVRIVD